MTMAEMDKYLTDKGFSVKREYDSKSSAYIFTIRKDNKFLNALFEYPGRDTWEVRTLKMRSFLDNLIHDFEKRFPETKPDTTNFMDDIRRNSGNAGLLINGHYYPISITEATVNHCFGEDANIEIEAKVLHACPNTSSSYAEYVDADIATTQFMYARRNGKNNMIKNMINSIYGLPSSHVAGLLKIEKVIYNYPATIVIWKDGTKTVVKAQNNEVFDKEKGLVMAMIKKALGNEGNYYEQIKKWL